TCDQSCERIDNTSDVFDGSCDDILDGPHDILDDLHETVECRDCLVDDPPHQVCDCRHDVDKGVDHVQDKRCQILDCLNDQGQYFLCEPHQVWHQVLHHIDDGLEQLLTHDKSKFLERVQEWFDERLKGGQRLQECIP